MPAPQVVQQERLLVPLLVLRPQVEQALRPVLERLVRQRVALLQELPVSLVQPEAFRLRPCLAPVSTSPQRHQRPLWPRGQVQMLELLVLQAPEGYSALKCSSSTRLAAPAEVSEATLSFSWSSCTFKRVTSISAASFAA